MSQDELIKRYGEPYITEDLLDMVVKVTDEDEDNKLLHDDSFKIWEKKLSINEQRYLSEFGRQVEKYSKEEFAVLVYVAIMNYPEMVFQLMMEEYLSVVNEENKRRVKQNEDSKDV